MKTSSNQLRIALFSSRILMRWLVSLLRSPLVLSSCYMSFFIIECSVKNLINLLKFSRTLVGIPDFCGRVLLPYSSLRLAALQPNRTNIAHMGESMHIAKE